MTNGKEKGWKGLLKNPIVIIAGAAVGLIVSILVLWQFYNFLPINQDNLVAVAKFLTIAVFFIMVAVIYIVSEIRV